MVNDKNKEQNPSTSNTEKINEKDDKSATTSTDPKNKKDAKPVEEDLVYFEYLSVKLKRFKTI